MAHFEDQQAHHEHGEAAGIRLPRVRVVQVGAQERGDVRSGLGDDEMVDVEELGDAGEGRVALGVVGLAPGVEGDFLRRRPWDDGTSFVFAFEDDGGIERCVGGVGGEGRGPYKLVEVSIVFEARRKGSLPHWVLSDSSGG